MENNKTREKVRERLLALQEKEKMTNQQFADYLGLSRQTLGFWQRGKRTPSAENIVDIADRCGVSTDYLLGKSDAQTNKPEVATMKEYTGLSEKSIEALHYMKKAPLASDSWKASADAISFINRVLEDYTDEIDSLDHDLSRDEYLHDVHPVFSLLEQWITGSGEPEEISLTKWVKDGSAIKRIKFAGMRIDDMFRIVTMAEIMKKLEDLAEKDGAFAETMKESERLQEEKDNHREDEDPDQEEK